ncbi:GntR family transcriptional regulator / MocR family aminotransferase [Streptomyces sp. SceaMP-e96]|uniref:aminotransferase-like domain-containing protein n=1 Tax=Streptomyces TaxID=1883 RepID=UPI0008238219|nr:MULTISPECIES: PLP-dependent aminotransferase family protein [unclassified Streptomyces]MYT13785.1 aminotransferase class I/II-fold pyridoxal phosphate-dependent enzyme [Streptomyces sp. SID4951]SCK55624.1 GntR family transcriptional regulator / MocR family aminotransferase [Streptomyces sp. SceaMP-e96]
MVRNKDQSVGHFHVPIRRCSAEELHDTLGGLERVGAGRLGLRLAGLLRELLRTGGLPAGTLMPPSRSVAETFGVSRGVVVTAYEQLLAEGFLIARQGAGTRVADSLTAATPSVMPSLPPPMARPGLPDLGGFPRARWLAAYRHVLMNMSSADFGYGDPRGHQQLRAELAVYLRRTRGSVIDPERVVVVNGVAEGLALLGDVVAASGRPRIGVEDPASPGARELMARRGLAVVGVPVDGEGIVVDAIREPGRLGAILLTPAHQYPTGVILSPARRHALIELACEHRVLLVEDDYDGAFRYARDPVGCLQGLAPDVTVLLGSVSKTLAPALRLGWLVAPRAWQEQLVARRVVTSLAGQAVDELAFAHLLLTGGYDIHVRQMRRRYHKRRMHLVAELDAAEPEVVVRGDASGLHLLAELPQRVCEHAVLSSLRLNGFDVQGLAECRVVCPPDAPGGLVIGYASLSPGSITRLVSVLSQAIGKLVR